MFPTWMLKTWQSRQNLIPYQRAELALRLKPVVERKAKANQSLGGGDKKSGCQKTDKAIIAPVDTKKELAAMAGISHDTLKRAEVIKFEASGFSPSDRRR